MASRVRRCTRRRPWVPALATGAVALAAAMPSVPAGLAHPGTDVPSGQVPVTGQVGVHDPTLHKEGDTYFVAATGGSIRSASSLGGPWTNHGAVPKADWTFDISPGALWAPHVEKIGDTFHFYYSQSSFGSQTSAIGLKTTETPTDPSSYVDHGEAIIASGAAGDPGDPFDHNAIDPHVSQDEEGDWWMTWGSHWDGIVIQRLDDDMVTPVGEMKLIASRGSDRFPIQPGFAVPPNRVEGPAIFRRGDYYYLLTGWDWCCQGANSTYKITVGRSESIDGPYVDKNGVPLTGGGGTTILDSRVARPGVTPDGLWRAPGGPDVFFDDGTHYLVYHAYRPQSTLGIRPIDWHGGWPYFQEPGEGPYDLTDGAHYRLVNEAAPAAADIERVLGPEGFGDAVRLNGPSAAQYVEMPAGILSELDDDFTIAAWVNRATLGQTWSRIFDFGSGTGSFLFLSANAGGANGGLRLDINTGGPVQTVPASGGGPQLPTTWQHVAFTLEGDAGTIWLNGEEFAQNPAITQRASGLGGSTQNWIGRSQFAADPLLDAAIDEFQIFDRALSEAELAALIAEPGGGEDLGGGNVAWYRFDEDGGENVLDASGQGNDATIVAGGLDPDAIHNPVPSDRCLTALGGGGSNVVQSTCAEDGHGQVWLLEREADGFHRFRSMAGDRGSCLAIANASGEQGTNVEVARCDGADERQQWYLDDTGHGFHRPVAKGANLALEADNDDGVVRTNVVGGYRRDGENRATHPATGVSCGSGPAVCADANQWPPQQWQLAVTEPPPVEVTDEPRLRLAAQPKQRRVGPRRKRVAYRVRVSNVGNAPAGAVRLCTTAPKRRVAIRGRRCRGLGTVAASQTRQRKVAVRIKPAARGRLTRVTLVARSADAAARRAAVRVRVRR